jgi:hypothetical protein
MPYSVACTFAALKGFGRHSAELTLEEFAAATKAEIIGQTLVFIILFQHFFPSLLTQIQ